MIVLLSLRRAILAGAGHRPVAVRAAGAAGAAVGRGRGRAAPAAGDRARAVDHVHGHDRRASRRSSTASASGSDPLRDVAIVVLLVFGRRAAAAQSRRARRGAAVAAGALRAAHDAATAFASGLLVGAALGFVYTPCASPILAAVISVSAASGKTIAIALAYAFGSARRAARAHARRPAGCSTAFAGPAAGGAAVCSARSARS